MFECSFVFESRPVFMFIKYRGAYLMELGSEMAFFVSD